MREEELFSVLEEHGQAHVIEAYKKLDDAGKEKLAAQEIGRASCRERV